MVTVWAPASATSGYRVSVVTTRPLPVVGAFSVAKLAPEALSVIASPLGSTATTLTRTVTPAFRVTLPMGDTIGAWAHADATGRNKSRAPRTRTLDAILMRSS